MSGNVLPLQCNRTGPECGFGVGTVALGTEAFHRLPVHRGLSRIGGRSRPLLLAPDLWGMACSEPVLPVAFVGNLRGWPGVACGAGGCPSGAACEAPRVIADSPAALCVRCRVRWDPVPGRLAVFPVRRPFFVVSPATVRFAMESDHHESSPAGRRLRHPVE
jgi:hypothetical protein